MYEVAKNPWNRMMTRCVMRTGAGRKCGGMMALVKSGGPKRPLSEQVGQATKEDGADLEAMLAPRGDLDRRLS
jgi:hypothetical protein